MKTPALDKVQRYEVVTINGEGYAQATDNVECDLVDFDDVRASVALDIAAAELAARADERRKFSGDAERKVCGWAADEMLRLLQSRPGGIGNVDANEVARACERFKALARAAQPAPAEGTKKP